MPALPLVVRRPASRAAAWIAGLVAAAVLLGAAPAHAQDAPPPRSARAVVHWLEAEDADADGPLRPHARADASGGAYLAADRRHASRDDPPRRGHARLAFTLTDGGTFRLFGRVGSPDHDADSFWLRVDGGRWLRWNGLPRTDDWAWAAVTDEAGGAPVALTLAPGPHTLEVALREGGARLDRLVLATDTTFTPVGPGPRPPRVDVVFRHLPR